MRKKEIAMLLSFTVIVWIFGFIVGYGQGQSSAYKKMHDSITVEKLYNNKHKK